jgi:hypothetical protein
VADKIEIWFRPTDGVDGEPTLLEARKFRTATDPPTTYDFGDGVELQAGRADTVQRDGTVVYRVWMFDPS